MKSQGLHKHDARCHLAHKKCLQILQTADCITPKSQENVQLLVKYVWNLRSRCIEPQNQIKKKKMEPYDDQSSIEEKTQKVGPLWTQWMKHSCFWKKEKLLVQSLL